MIEVTDEQVLETLREVVAGKEGFVYEVPDDGEMCLYVHEDEHGRKCPGCLVAQVFHRLGGSLDGMQRAEGDGPALSAACAGIVISDGADSALSFAQMEQDIGVSWGNALAVAEEAFGV